MSVKNDIFTEEVRKTLENILKKYSGKPISKKNLVSDIVSAFPIPIKKIFVKAAFKEDGSVMYTVRGKL